mgnify:CR=1 FL=1
MVDLRRGVHLQVHVRECLLERADGVDVELEVDVRVLAVDDVDLGEAGELALADRVLDELLGRCELYTRLQQLGFSFRFAEAEPALRDLLG